MKKAFRLKQEKFITSKIGKRSKSSNMCWM